MVVGQKLSIDIRYVLCKSRNAINIISKFSMNSDSWLCQVGISLEDTNTKESSIE